MPKLVKNEEIENMEECKHLNTIQSNSTLVCKDCGLVLDENNLVSFPRRFYDKEQLEARTHHEIEDGFTRKGTMMMFSKKDLMDKTLSKYMRLRKRDGWKRDTIDRKVQNIRVSILTFLTSHRLKNNNLIRLVEYYILKTGNINLQGRTLNCYSAALLIYCLREEEIPFNIRKILRYYSEKAATVYRLIQQLVVDYDLENLPPIPLSIYVNYWINEVCSKYNLPDGLVSKLHIGGIKCLEILSTCSRGKSKLCDTAGIIYYLMKTNDIKVTQEQISAILEVTTVSLRNAYQSIRNQILPLELY